MGEAEAIAAAIVATVAKLQAPATLKPPAPIHRRKELDLDANCCPQTVVSFQLSVLLSTWKRTRQSQALTLAKNLSVDLLDLRQPASNGFGF
jgi:hypothetical protein